MFSMIKRVSSAVATLPVFWVLAVGTLPLASVHQTALAAGSSSSYESSEDDPFHDVNNAIKAENYAEAITLLEAMKSESPKNADVHNLLGFSNRKLGNFDVAFEHYQAALEIDPEHIRAHEYLGELYLQTDRLAEAEQQLEKVSDLCSLFCKEKKMLKKAIKQYKAENS